MTVFHQYLEIKLERATGETLRQHVTARRGEGMTWQQIADNLHDVTGVTVSRESLRKWFPEMQQDGDAA